LDQQIAKGGDCKTSRMDKAYALDNHNHKHSMSLSAQ